MLINILGMWFILSFLTNIFYLIEWDKILEEKIFFISYIWSYKELNILGKILLILILIPITILGFIIGIIMELLIKLVTWHPKR